MRELYRQLRNKQFWKNLAGEASSSSIVPRIIRHIVGGPEASKGSIEEAVGRHSSTVVHLTNTKPIDFECSDC